MGQSPAERARNTKAAFEAKVSLLEEWAKHGVPAGERSPKDNTALRQWVGPSAVNLEDGTALGTWADPMIDRPVVGKYPDLTRRFLAARDAIKKQKGKEETLAQELTRLKREVAALVDQNGQLIGEIMALKEMAGADADIRASNARSPKA
ncbi:hypothetical protein [Sphingobium yanoikuyae]|uniref:hypothetical protein n=1 Tax=Sphingobium yanoikuyae TaxID=13690 RepID=UPI0028B025E2|nr:hypothetical protein [Sphingobium yanoikuyae]